MLPGGDKSAHYGVRGFHLFSAIIAILAAAWVAAIAQFSLGLTGEEVRLDALMAAFFLFGALVGTSCTSAFELRCIAASSGDPSRAALR